MRFSSRDTTLPPTWHVRVDASCILCTLAASIFSCCLNYDVVHTHTHAHRREAGRVRVTTEGIARFYQAPGSLWPLLFSLSFSRARRGSEREIAASLRGFFFVAIPWTPKGKAREPSPPLSRVISLRRRDKKPAYKYLARIVLLCRAREECSGVYDPLEPRRAKLRCIAPGCA